MSGTNWTEFSGVGSGDLQLAQYVAPVAFDSLGRLYIADGGNKRVVRMDDMSGTNWTTLTQSQPAGMYIYLFGSPLGVALDASDRIYVADGQSVVRVADMTGANWTSIGIGSSATPHSIAVDASGMVLVGGGGAFTVDNMVAVQASSSTLTEWYGPYYVFGATPVPVSSPLPSAIRFSPSTLTFSQNVGTTSAAQTITITNFGGSPLNSLALSATGGFAETDNCPPTLAPAASCTVSVTFTPAATGDIAGTLQIADDSGNLGPTQTIALTGTGTTPAASLTPTSLAFSSTIVGTTSTARTITLQSVGTGPLTISGVTASAPFVVTTTTCSGTLAPGVSCTIQVVFAPAAIGAASGAVTIADDAGTQTVALTGSGSAPVSLSASSISFGSVVAGNASTVRSVTITNRLPAALAISSITATPPFAIASTTCGAVLNAGANCSVGVQFVPTALGTASGSLVVTDSALTSPQVVALSGTGTAPVTLSATAISFGTVTVGTTSSARTVTVTNKLAGDLTFASIAASAPFAVSATTCGATLPTGTSCTVSVVFAPVAKTTATGALTITDSALTSPQTVTLSGTGR
jgi:hypothetical protein